MMSASSTPRRQMLKVLVFLGLVAEEDWHGKPLDTGERRWAGANKKDRVWGGKDRDVCFAHKKYVREF